MDRGKSVIELIEHGTIKSAYFWLGLKSVNE